MLLPASGRPSACRRCAGQADRLRVDRAARSVCIDTRVVRACLTPALRPGGLARPSSRTALARVRCAAAAGQLGFSYPGPAAEQRLPLAQREARTPEVVAAVRAGAATAARRQRFVSLQATRTPAHNAISVWQRGQSSDGNKQPSVDPLLARKRIDVVKVREGGYAGAACGRDRYTVNNTGHGVLI